MEFSQAYYPAKILLFGEYVVLLGGSGLSLPWAGHGSKWIQDPKAGPEFRPFLDFLSRTESLVKELDTRQLAADYDEGWRLSSTIPIGSGLGSSGVLCAAIFDRYRRRELTVDDTRKILAEMEEFFHGRSSGLDPLVSFFKKAVVSRNNELKLLKEIPNLSGPGYKIELIDSEIPRETRVLVEQFRNQIDSDATFRKIISEKLIPANEDAIQSMLSHDHTRLIDQWQVISSLSLNVFSNMIPECILNTWQAGLSSEREFYKLCGAGGGGYFLKLSLL